MIRSRALATLLGVAILGCSEEGAIRPPSPPPPPDTIALPPPPAAAPPPATVAPTATAAPTSSAPPATSAAPAPSAAAPSTAPPAAPSRHALRGVVTAPTTRQARNVVVYLEDAPVEPDRGMTAVIDQRGMQFLPFVRVVAAGGKVRFANSDPFPHNVFSPDPDRFNLGMLSQGASRVLPFNKVGAHSLLCATHPGMQGYVFVSPSSYFAVTDANGAFEIKDVPEGTYKIAAWGVKLVSERQPVEVKGGDASVALAVHR